MPTRYQGTDPEQQALDLMIAVARGSEAFLQRVQKPIVEAGLTPSQFGVLETLFHLGPLRPSEIAEKHLRSRNNLSVVMEHLVRDGLIERTSCPNDRRCIYVSLTPVGRERIEAIFPNFARAVAAEAAALDPGEQAELVRLMKKLGRPVQRDVETDAALRAKSPTKIS